MIRKLFFLFISVPIAVVLILLSVANRTPITLSLDPFRPESPAYAITAPFFVYVFVALITGLLIGAVITWLSQGRHRKRAKYEHNQVEKWKAEAENSKKRADELAAEKTNELLGLEAAKQAS
ncbi:MAG: LapA family protein [Nitratireductor sp.]